MKSLFLVVCAVIFGLGLVLPMSGLASGDDQKKEGDSARQKETSTKKENHHQKKAPKMINNLPIYKPPLRGAPAGRVAAGTRGADQELPYLCLIVPEHVGLTIFSQPRLYYYQSKTSSFPVEFTLIENQGINPIVEKRIDPPKKAGIQSVSIEDCGVTLEPGIQYKWFIALVPDPIHRSKDILAAGGIERIPDPESVKKNLETSDISHAPHIYAEAGLWYDAFDTLSLMIEKSPNDTGLRQQRNALLEQIGLDQVTD
jgi:hypothetical protein